MRIPNQSAGIFRSAPGTSLRGGVFPSIFWGVVIGAAIGFTFGPEIIGVVIDEITRPIGDFPVPDEGADTPA